MKTPGQRGPFGEWLAAERKRRYPTQLRAVAEIERLTGLRIAVSEFAQWESGSRVPKEDNPKVAALYAFFGSEPQTPLEPVPTDVTALTALVRDLLEELRAERADRAADRTERLAWERGVVESVQAIALALSRRGGREPAPPGDAQP